MSMLNPRELFVGPALALLLVFDAPRPVAAQTPAAPVHAAPTSVPTTATPPAPMTGAQVIQLLDQTVNWYRTLGIQQQAASEPSDLLILYDNRQTASHVIGLAFDIARANVEILAK